MYSMWKVLVFLSFSITVTLAIAVSKQPFTLGGRNVKPGEVPYIAQITKRGTPYMLSFCQGVILNRFTVLVAIDCANKLECSINKCEVHVGRIELTHGGQTVSVTKIIPHPIPVPLRILHTTEIMFNNNVSPVNLPMEDFRDNTDVRISGWGRSIIPTQFLWNNLQSGFTKAKNSYIFKNFVYIPTGPVYPCGKDYGKFSFDIFGII